MYTLMTPSRILSHRCYQEWAQSQRSALLFIHGATRREGRARSVAMPCWLSPAGIHIFEHLKSLEESRTFRNRIIYFSCRPDQENSIDQAADVLTMVALGLLDKGKDLPRERLNVLQRFVSSTSSASSYAPSPPWSRTSFSSAGSPISSSPDLGSWSQLPPVIPTGYNHHGIDVTQDASSIAESLLDQRRVFLKEVLEELSKTESQPTEGVTQRISTAYIILDRLDCTSESVKLKTFLRELALLIAESNALCVKIVAMAEAHLQENSWKDSLPGFLLRPDQAFEIKMDQRELSSLEMAKEKGQILWKD